MFSNADFIDTTVDEIIDEITKRKRIIIKVKVDIFGESEDKIMTSVFDWFITLN